jgi:hypothetical protein
VRIEFRGGMPVSGSINASGNENGSNSRGFPDFRPLVTVSAICTDRHNLRRVLDFA